MTNVRTRAAAMTDIRFWLFPRPHLPDFLIPLPNIPPDFPPLPFLILPLERYLPFAPPGRFVPLPDRFLPHRDLYPTPSPPSARAVPLPVRLLSFSPRAADGCGCCGR